jgi:hypothetical protein
VEDLDLVQRLAAVAILHHDVRRGDLPHRADEARGKAAGAPRTQPAGAPRRWQTRAWGCKRAAAWMAGAVVASSPCRRPRRRSRRHSRRRGLEGRPRAPSRH